MWQDAAGFTKFMDDDNARMGAAAIVAFAAAWAVSDTQARVAAPATVQMEPFKVMTSAKQLPTEHFADYSFVFN